MPKGYKITPKKKRRIIELYAIGYSYREIEVKEDVGKATISKVLKEASEREPELKDLRDIVARIRESGRSFLEIVRIANVLQEFEERGVSPRVSPTIIEFCEAVEDPIEAARCGLEIQAIIEKSGLTYQKAVDEHRKRDAEIGEMKTQLRETKTELKSTSKQLEDAEALKRLQGDLRRYGITPDRMEGFVRNAIEIERDGFTPEVSAHLSKEMKRYGLDPHKAAEEMVEDVVRHGNLKGAIASGVSVKADLETTIRNLEPVAESLRKRKSQYEQKITNLENECKYMEHKKTRRALELQKTIKDLDAKYERKERKLENDYKIRSKRLGDHIAELRDDVRSLQNERDRLQFEIESITNVKGSIESYHSYLNECKRDVRTITEKIESLTATKTSIETEIQASIEWTRYLLSGEIPRWESTIWKDLETMLKVRDGELPPSTHLKPASESVRKRMVALYKEIVKEDIADIWDYNRLEKERDSYKEALKEERIKSTKTEYELNQFKTKWEEKVKEEVFNSLQHRWRKIWCKECFQYFLIDKKARRERTQLKCPYCIWSSRTVELGSPSEIATPLPVYSSTPPSKAATEPDK